MYHSALGYREEGQRSSPMAERMTCDEIIGRVRRVIIRVGNIFDNL